MAVVVGGEPFLRPDILRILGAIRGSGCKVGLVTTARPLLYPKIREGLRRIGLVFLRVQVFGYGSSHDRACGVTDAFAQTLEALAQWSATRPPDCDLDIGLSTRGRPLAEVLEEVDPIIVAISRFAPRLVLALDDDAVADLRSSPALQVALNRCLEPSAGRLPIVVETSASPDGAWLQPATFAAVANPASCLGVLPSRVAAPLHAEQPKANSFNFVRTEVSVAATPNWSSCEAHRAGDVAGSNRQLWLSEGDRLVLYATDTGDFSPVEINRIKGELSHLFIDRAAAGVLDDFTDGMRRVLPDPFCSDCDRRDICGRRFMVVEGAPYAAEEEWIRAYVLRLRGDVLDVGCGEQLYRHDLAPLLADGAVRYTGLDPDERSLAVARTALPEGTFHLGGIEELDLGPASYDRVLCLRSWNHVRDTEESMARMNRLLRPGGQLLVVECTPFAMLRRREQVVAADRAPRAGHQHLRNDASYDLLPLIRRQGLRVAYHRPAERAGSNEWILLLEKP